VDLPAAIIVVVPTAVALAAIAVVSWWVRSRIRSDKSAGEKIDPGDQVDRLDSPR
jgi:hypothetical protein